MRQTSPEEVSIIVLMERGALKPLIFYRQGKPHRVERVISEYRGVPGDLEIRCYSVVVRGGGHYYLQHDRSTGVWRVSELID